MEHPNWVGARGAHGERTHPRQTRRHRSLLNIPQGSDGQDSKGETATRWCEEPQIQGGVSMKIYRIFPFGNLGNYDWF